MSQNPPEYCKCGKRLKKDAEKLAHVKNSSYLCYSNKESKTKK